MRKVKVIAACILLCSIEQTEGSIEKRPSYETSECHHILEQIFHSIENLVTIANEEQGHIISLAIKKKVYPFEFIALLLAKGVRIFPEELVLHDALDSGYSVDQLGFLIKNGGNLHLLADDGTPLLHRIIKDEKLEVPFEFIKFLIEKRGANVDAVDGQGRSLLHIIAEGNINVDVLDLTYLLFKNGANVNAVDEAGNTPLHLALIANDFPELAENFIYHDRVNLDIQGMNGETPLHIATLMRKRTLAEMLIERGANMDILDGNRETPLHIAIRMGKRELAEMLIERGANMDIPDGNGETARNKIEALGWIIFAESPIF
ncbi:MAG: ankyrin repeat domain-containing protein [Holosporales bacterium]|jgi:ankyrin repeat protein|nr:ankyrin repeat domain-containing protein [Holosporales bacterium]